MLSKTHQTETAKDFHPSPSPSPSPSEIAEAAIEFGNAIARDVQRLKQQGLEAGYKFKEYEEATSKSELLELLKEHYPKDLVRYFRNLVAQAKLVDRHPHLYDALLNLPACHAAALLAATEEQVEQIIEAIALGNEQKWTIALIKERIRNIPEPKEAIALAPGIPVKVLLEAPNIEKGAIGIVEAMSKRLGEDAYECVEDANTGNTTAPQHGMLGLYEQSPPARAEEIISVNVVLFSGETLKLQPTDVETLDPDIFQQLAIALLMKEGEEGEGEEEGEGKEGEGEGKEEIKVKIAKLNKCCRFLSNKLRISELACSYLSKAIRNLPLPLPLPDAIALNTDYEKAFNAYGIVEESDQTAIIAKANLAARLLQPEKLKPTPTVGQLASAIADFLHKPTKKTGKAGIPMSAKDYNELTHLIQQQHQEIQALRNAMDAQNAAPATNREQELLEAIAALQQDLAAKNTALEQLTEQLTHNETEPQNPSPSPSPSPSSPSPNDIVRILHSHIESNIGKLGKFLGIERQNNGLAVWEEAKILIDEGGKYPMPIYIRNWQQNLEPVNLTAAELVEINRTAAIASELEKEIEELKELYSGSAIASEVGKALVPVFGKSAVEELKEAGKNGLYAIGRQLKKLIEEMMMAETAFA